MKKFSRYIIEIEFEGRNRTEYVANDVFTIGRSSDCDIHIDSKNLSRQHMKVSLVGNEIFIEDLKSTNGCFLDGEPLEPGTLISYSTDKILSLGKHDDVILTLKAKFEIESSPSKHKIKDDLKDTFSKDSLDLKDPPPKKAERDYKEIMHQVEILKTEIIDRAEKRADKIIEEAKAESEKLTSESKHESEKSAAQARVNADKIMAEAVEQSKNIKEQTDLADILREIEDKRNELNRVNEIITTCRENLKSLELKNTQFLELEEKNTELELKIKSLKRETENLFESQKDIEGKISISNQDLEKILKEKTDVAKILSETKSKNSELESKQSKLEKDVETLVSKKDRLESQVSDLGHKQSELDKLVIQLKEVQSNLEEKNSAFKEILIEIQNVNTDLKALKDLQLNLQTENTKQKLQIDSEQEKLTRLQEEYKDFLDKKTSLNTEIEDVKNQKEASVHELAELKEKAQTLSKECDQKIKKATDEADLVLSQAKAKAQSEHLELVQKSKQDIIEKEESLLSHAKLQANEIIEKAKTSSNKIELELKQKHDEMLLRAEVKAEKVLKDSQERSDELRDRGQAEYQKRIKEAESEADNIKVRSIQVMDEKKKDFVELEKKRIRKSSELLKSELNVLLYSKLKLYLKEDGEDYAARVRASLEAAVNSCMLSEVIENDEEMYALLDDQVLKQQQKTINYWRYTVPGVLMSLVLVYFAVPFFKEKIKDESRKVASISKQETENRIRQMDSDAKKALFEFFNPKKSNEFKSTYTDRVLYTDKYAKVSLDKDYREDWILDLQTFFVDDLELSENALVPFISQEANMIRELVAQSKKINGKFIDQGISKMREIEDEFLVKLKVNLRDERDFRKIMAFQKKFFNKKVKKY